MTDRDDINAVAVEHVLAALSREDVLTRRAHRWRCAALATTAMATALMGVVVGREYERRQMPTPYVVVLQAGKVPPADWHNDDRSNVDPAVRVLRASRSREIAVMILSTARGSDYLCVRALHLHSPR